MIIWSVRSRSAFQYVLPAGQDFAFQYVLPAGQDFAFQYVLPAGQDFAACRDLSASDPPEPACIADCTPHRFALRRKSFPAERTYMGDAVFRSIFDQQRV